MIPEWNIAGVLPPVRPGVKGESPDRSPYLASLSQVIERFTFSPERIEILRGLIAYRAELRKRGITTGFQWLNGSFMEHKEALLGMPPNDVDVVTFFTLPMNTDETAFVLANSDLFDTGEIKKHFKVDTYPFLLGREMTPLDIRQIAYWYSMWSHQRGGLWKGFVQVDLTAEEDEIASNLLLQIEHERTAL